MNHVHHMLEAKKAKRIIKKTLLFTLVVAVVYFVAMYILLAHFILAAHG